jgi:hypothetical protein
VTDLSDELTAYFRTAEAWAENERFMARTDVIHHEVNFETRVHPVTLEFLFLEYLQLIGRRVRSVGHAIVGDLGYIKLYTIERPILNVVWRFNPEVTIGPQERWYTTWTDADVSDYMNRIRPRQLAQSELKAVDRYFADKAWQEIEEKLRDSETEHFHVFVRTELDPFDLEAPFRKAIERTGLEIEVPAFYLAQPEEHPLAEPGREAMWLGLAPNGTKNLEISCIHAPGTLLEPKELSREERYYGGDGWTTSQYRRFVQQSPYEALTLGEARVVAAAMAQDYLRAHPR